MSVFAPAALRVFRDAVWLSRARARAYCTILLAVTLLIATGLIVTSHGGIDLGGKPLGTDLISFWTASRRALEGHPTAAYDMAIHHASEVALFGKAASNYTAFFYPPVFLLVCLPLAALPYVPSLVAWLVLTGYGFWRCSGRSCPSPAWCWRCWPFLPWRSISDTARTAS